MKIDNSFDMFGFSYSMEIQDTLDVDPRAVAKALKECLETFVPKREVLSPCFTMPIGPGKSAKRGATPLLFHEKQVELPLLEKILAESPEKTLVVPEEIRVDVVTTVETTVVPDPEELDFALNRALEIVAPTSLETVTEQDKPLRQDVAAADLIKAKNRRDLIRIIMSKGHTTLDEVVAVCTSLKDQVPALKSWSDIPTAVKVSYERVIVEDAEKTN